MAVNKIARKSSKFRVVFTVPDFCWPPPPAPPSVPPIPFPLFADLGGAKTVAKDVRLNRKPAFIFNASKTHKTYGDEIALPGRKGVKSRTATKPAWPMRHSSSVKIRKRYIVRTGDMFHMNGKFSKRLPPKTCLSCKGAVGAGRPVNPIHGLKFLEGETDFTFEGILPLVWSRSYYSDQDGTGWLGEGWSVPGCQRIIRDAAGLAYIDDQGRLFPLPEVDEDDEEPVLFESEQIWFSKNPDGHYVIASLDGSIALRFAPLVVAEDGSDEDSTLFPLVAVEDANGNHQRFVYHPLTGLPQYVIDGNGRVFSLNFGNVADEQSPKMRLLSVSLLEGLPAFGETARIGNLVRAANRLKTYNGTTYYYDELGNLIHRELADGEVQNYFYDLHDQLVKAEIFKKDGTKETWAYTYDALGRRIGKGRLKNEEVSDGLEGETGFVWDGSHLLQEVQPDGRYTYIYTDPDSYEPLAQVRNWTNEDGESRQQTRYFHCDQIGIPREMTDKDGNLVWFGNYTGWGRLKEETKVTDSAYQPFRLQNQYADRETGLHYNFFRYYEPDAGRFVNQDPIGLEGGENLYAFAPNTGSWIDPLGLFGLAGTIPGSGGFGSSVAATGHQHAAAANNAAAAIVASRSKSHTAVGRCNKDEQDPCSQFPTKNAARTIALKEAGIPTSSTPIAQNITPNWEQYMYKNPNGSRTPLIISHHPSDAKHPCPHWHVGTAKMDGNLVQKRNNGNGTFSWKYYKDNVTVQHRK